MKWIIKIIDFLVLPRETRELSRLNNIWEDFNENKIDPLPRLLKYKWKYHHKKIKLLIDFNHLNK